MFRRLLAYDLFVFMNFGQNILNYASWANIEASINLNENYALVFTI